MHYDSLNVLVTGGTGALARGLIHYLLRDVPESPERLVSYARSEFRQQELYDRWGHYRPFRTFLGDVRDFERLKYAMDGIDVVIHAAALKRVDSIAYNPTEVIKTNILGTQNVVEAAIAEGVKKVVVVSSDKAVEAANIYGATKACCEHMAVALNTFGHKKGTAISVVRYGNVLTSTGSAFWIFKDQKARDVPFTITDNRMTRFGITMREAVEFIWGCVFRMRGGEIFVPEIPSFKLTTLTEAIAPGHPIEEMGLRSGGEKLAEVLISQHESAHTVRDARNNCYVVNPTHAEWGYSPWEAGEHGLTSLTSGFSYDSATNTNFLNASQLKRKLEDPYGIL